MNNEGNAMNYSLLPSVQVHPYALFAGDTYYPRGGMNDLIGRYETIEEAKAVVDNFEWYQIVYLPTLNIIERRD